MKTRATITRRIRREALPLRTARARSMCVPIRWQGSSISSQPKVLSQRSFFYRLGVHRL